MKSAKLENLISGGFCFLKSCSDNTAIYENKYTGLWIIYNHETSLYRVMED